VRLRYPLVASARCLNVGGVKIFLLKSGDEGQDSLRCREGEEHRHEQGAEEQASAPICH
jgi:hypothetical protein